MDSRWYLFHDQTLENTKISDREHALHISKTAWDGITKHLDRKKLIQDEIDKELAAKRYLEEGSKNMTKSWDNSLENVMKRKEEERLRLIEERKEERQRWFMHLRKEQEDIRDQYMDKVKKQIFLMTGHARNLTSALIASEVLYERQKQQEFMEKIKAHDKEEDAKYLEIQRVKAEAEEKAEQEKKVKQLEKQKIYAKELKKTIEDTAAWKKTYKENKVKKEALDNIEAVKESEKLERFILAKKLQAKKDLANERKKFREQQHEIEKDRAKEEKEMDEVVDIYKEAKHKIDCMKKSREKELRDLVVMRRQKIAAMVMAEQADRSEAENRSIQKALDERDAAEMEKIKAKQEFQEKMRQERLKNHKDFLEKEAEKKLKEEEITKWELLNRYKADECTRKHDENKKKEAWEKVLKYRGMLMEQMEENKLEHLREKEIDGFMQRSYVVDDAKFFEYANDVLEMAKKRGRTTVPIENVIKDYLKENNIHDELWESFRPRKSREMKAQTEAEKKMEKKAKKKSKNPKPYLCLCPKR